MNHHLYHNMTRVLRKGRYSARLLIVAVSLQIFCGHFMAGLEIKRQHWIFKPCVNFLNCMRYYNFKLTYWLMREPCCLYDVMWWCWLFGDLFYLRILSLIIIVFLSKIRFVLFRMLQTRCVNLNIVYSSVLHSAFRIWLYRHENHID